MTEKGSKWALQIRRLTRPSWGVTPKYARHLYIGVALPRVLYGADVWCGPSIDPKFDSSAIASARVINQLTKIQHSGAVAITGALRTSPTDTLDVCAFLLPCLLTVEKWCHRAAVRLSSLPPEHPLYKPVKSIKSRKVRRHKSPLHLIFRSTTFDPKRIEKIPAKPRNPAHIGKLPFKVSIASSKEASILEDRNAQDQIRIYSDGSAHEGKVGAAAILTQTGKPNRTLHYHLGPDSERTVAEAELIGIVLAMHLLLTEKHRNVPCAIGTDNHAALEAYNTNLRNPAHQAAREALRLGNMLQKRTKGKQYALTLRWTAGHVGILGNELADVEAKRAAGGHTSDKSSLPPFLRRTLTVNPSAILRKSKAELKRKWDAAWKRSHRSKKIAKIDNKTPSAHLLRIISNADISRRSASLVTQILTEHIPLNEYLNRFKLVDSPRCPACRSGSESVRHFLLECPIYVHERWLLEKWCRKRNKALTLENLLDNEEAIKPLTNFIHASLRFSSDSYPSHPST